MLTLNRFCEQNRNMKHRRGINLVPDSFRVIYEGTVSRDLYPTLDSYPEWYVFGGRCSRCEREGWVDRKDLTRRFGSGIYLTHLRPKLRCMKCGNKGNNNWIFGKLARD
ncbi:MULTISPECIES: hypothetical protein [unclassified Agrobacterium]